MRANLGCHPVVLSGDLHRHRSSSDIFRIIAETTGFQDIRSQAEIIPHMLRAVGIRTNGHYLSSQFGVGVVGDDLADPDFAGDYGGHGGLAGDLVRLGRALERSADADPVRDTTTTYQHGDRKTLWREQEKKIALGHKEDDHEEEPTWQQTMR